MPLLIVAIGILVLLVLVGRFKLNAFFALLITSFVVGLLNGLNLLEILDSILKGIGETERRQKKSRGSAPEQAQSWDSLKRSLRWKRRPKSA